MQLATTYRMAKEAIATVNPELIIAVTSLKKLA